MIQDLNRTLSKHFSISFIFQMTCMLTIWCPRSNCRPQQWLQLEQHLPLHHFKTRIKSAPVYISVVVLLQAQRSSLHSCSGDSELAFINLDGWCVQYWYNSINSNCKFWCGGTMMMSLWHNQRLKVLFSKLYIFWQNDLDFIVSVCMQLYCKKHSFILVLLIVKVDFLHSFWTSTSCNVEYEGKM